MLMQRGKFIAYASVQLKTNETNYITYDFELRSCSVFLKDFKALYIWNEVCRIHRPQKPLAHLRLERSQHETTKVGELLNG